MGTTTHVIQIKLESTGPAFKRDMETSSSAVKKVGGDLDDAGKKASGAGREFVSLGGLVKEAASNFAGYLSAQGIFQALSAAANFAKETILGFDNEMTQSLAIMGDVSDKTRKSMEGTARETAVKYNTAVADVAKGYYYLASAGYDAATSQKAIGQVTAFAKAGMFDLEQATELAADAQNAMGLKSADSSENLVQLTRITDVLTKANIDANGSVEDFAKALTNKAAAGARLANISLEETVSVLEVFAAQGLKGKRAGEAFSIVLRDLQDKSMKNKDAFEALGISVYKADGSFAGFKPIVSQLENALKGMSVQQANATISTLGFTVEGASYLKTLLGMSDQLGVYEGKLRSAGGATQQIAERQMQSMVEKLAHMKALAADLALTGFDKLTMAVKFLGDQFGPALGNSVDAVKDLARWLEPVGRLLLVIAGGAVVGGLMAIARAVELATGFLKDHEAILQLVASVGLAMLLASLTSATIAWLDLGRVALGVGWLNLITMLTNARIALMAMGTASEAAAGGMTLVKGVVSSTAFQVGILAGLIFGLVQAFSESHEQAQKWADGLTRSMNTSNIDSMSAAVRNLAVEHDKLVNTIQGQNAVTQFFYGLADVLIPVNDLSDSVYDMGVKVDETQARMDDLGKKTEEAKSQIMQMAHELSPTEKALESAGGQFRFFNAHADQLKKIAAGEEINRISGELVKLAIAANIDMSKPVEEWKDQLHLAWVESQNTSPTLAILRDAFQSVGDVASTAEDAIKAYKDVLDALIGVHISEAEAEDKFAGALDGLSGKLFAGINLQDAYNVKNREGREAVGAAADAAMAHAVSVYEESGSLEQANAVLARHRDQLIASMMATGMSRDAAIAYLNTLGLTPATIETTAHLHKDEAQAKANELQGQMEQAAKDRTATVTANTGQAIAAADELKRHLQDAINTGAQLGPGGAAGASIGNILGRAQGGITLRQFAGGGMNEAHTAQIAQAGDWRLWAEPETGGEAYIPLGMGKRKQSLDILRRVSGMFGYQLKPYATGGIVGGPGMGGAGVMISPGAVQVSVTTGASSPVGIASEVERAVRPILAEFAGAVRTEIRARRV